MQTARTSKILRIAATLTLLWSPALFAENKGSQFGMLYGLSVPDAENTKQYYLFGLRGAAFVNPSVSFGGYFMQSDNKGEKSVTQKFRYSLTGMEAAYHIPSGGADTFFALRIGVTKVENTQGGEDLIFSPYHYGVAVGYDYYLGTYTSIGFEGSYLHVQPGRTEGSTLTFETKSFNIISFLMSLQIHL